MGKALKEASSFYDICVKDCAGACCDPWWGIFSYTAVKHGALSNMDSFKNELVKGIREREKKIIKGYITGQNPPQPLFSKAERYSIILRGTKLEGASIAANLTAMFAFRCRFLKEDKTCAIHPSDGRVDIRPPHCGYMGSKDALPDEKGFCNIIHVALLDPVSSGAVKEAIAAGKNISSAHFNQGFPTPEEAAASIIEKITKFYEINAPHASAHTPKNTGRNDPCLCGSGKKFKRCHDT